LKQLVKQEPRGYSHVAPKINVSIPQSTTDEFSVSIEVKITPSRPICPRCGESQKRVAFSMPRGVTGLFWICPNETCPSHNPDGGAAAQDVIDVEPIGRAA